MYLACLMPTFGRPSLAANSLALYLRQKLEGHTADLFILDDAGQIASQCGGEPGHRWHVYANDQRYPTLPAKYRELVSLAGPEAEAYVVWDDDDVYLPWHLAAHADTLARYAWSHPSAIYSTYGRQSIDDRPAIEPAAGRFHGALGIRRDTLQDLGGWIQTADATFDQQMLAALGRYGRPGDPCRAAGRIDNPSYVYRWSDTERWHCSGVMDCPDWYQRTPIEEPGRVERLVPKLDASSRELLEMLA